MEYDQKKGGEDMSLEGIKQVTEAETLAQQRKNEALAQAKKTVADARRAGEERLSSARIQAEAQVKGFLQEAEERASKHTEQVLAETRQACDALRQEAEGRLADAAALKMCIRDRAYAAAGPSGRAPCRWQWRAGSRSAD